MTRLPAKKLVRRLLTALALLSVFLTAGCGYRFAPTGENIGVGIKKVYVGAFTNNTAEPNIEMAFRNAFIDQFIRGRRFDVTDSEEAADAVVKGDIKRLVSSPLAYRNDNLALEKRFTVNMAVMFQERGTKKVIWREENFSQWGDYAVDATDIVSSERIQKNALIKLANDAAERAYRVMISDF